MDKNNSSK